MALTTQQGISAALNMYMQERIKEVQQKLTAEFTTRYRKALVQIATDFSVRVDEFYQLETQQAHVIVTLKVPLTEDERVTKDS